MVQLNRVLRSGANSANSANSVGTNGASKKRAVGVGVAAGSQEGSDESVAAHDLLQLCAGEPSGLPRKLARRFGGVVHMQDVVTVLEADRKLGGFRRCSQRARELLAECVINLLILEGAFTPLGLDTYRVNAV